MHLYLSFFFAAILFHVQNPKFLLEGNHTTIFWFHFRTFLLLLTHFLLGGLSASVLLKFLSLNLLLLFGFVFYSAVFTDLSKWWRKSFIFKMRHQGMRASILYLLAIKYLLINICCVKFSWPLGLAFPKTLFLLSLKSESWKYLYKIILFYKQWYLI